MANALEPRDFITIGGIIVTTTVALVVAHLHRKQMRQIEAYRSDPSVGLVPPPNPIRVFFNRYSLLICAALGCALLVSEAWSSSPVRAKDVIRIAVLVVSTVLALLLHWIVQPILKDIMKTFYLIGDKMKEHLSITKELVQRTEPQRSDQKGSGDLASDTAAHTQARVD